ncbi:MAG: serpin family protein [Candidatus Neomarinimicrobiota bacterium]
MRKSIIIAVTVLMAACSNESTGPDQTPKQIRALTAKEQALVQANQSFSFNLLKAVSTTDQSDNIFISPLSVSMALGMTMNGASGQTYDDMKTALEFAGLTEAEINRSYQSLMELLTTIDPDVTMEIANSIWVREGFPAEVTFIDTNRHYFSAEVGERDFGDPATIAEINAWVADNTNNKIQEILTVIPPAAVMYLINAIYYKAIWQYEFDEKYTGSANFYVTPENPVSVDMMLLTADLNYFTDDRVQVVELNYGCGNYTMTIFLPKLPLDINEFLNDLTAEQLDYYLSNLEEKTGTVRLPRLKTAYKLTLNDVLIQLGMGIAFSDQADFTRINPGGNLFISRVLHKTFVQIDEEGTEAAAVTAVEVSLTSVGPDVDFSLNVNRPYIFLIREQQTGAILFTGKIHGPVWED